MNCEDEEHYWTPAASALFGHVVDRSLDYAMEAYLEKALHTTIWTEWKDRPMSKDFPLSDYWRNLLVQLAGPHGRAILKMYQIQKGLEHVE
jgi:hypothetical protein